jgi:hypothetical protein
VSQLQFCNEFLDLVKNNSNILNTLLSDEAHFQVSGYVNKQNCCYWALNNPHELYQCPLHSAKRHCGVKFILMALSILISLKTWMGVQALCMQSGTKSCWKHFCAMVTSLSTRFAVVPTRWSNCSHSRNFHASPQDNFSRQTHFSFCGHHLPLPLT